MLNETQKELGNKFIAEFMGYKYYPKVKIPTWYYDLELSDIEELDEDDIWVLEPSEEFEKHLCVSSVYYEDKDILAPYTKWKYSLEYHSSMDWLLPVIEKIEQSHEVCIIFNECEITTTGYQVSRVAFAKGETKLEAVWLACVEFIKKFNANEV